MRRALVATVLAGCGGPQAEPVPPSPVEPGAARDRAAGSNVSPRGACNEATKKAMPLIVELTKTHARPVALRDLVVIENDCLNFGYEAQKADPDVTCLNEARDDAAARACWTASLARPRDKTEATKMLEMVATKATAVLRRDGALPRGDVFPTPAIPCCARIGHRCRGGYDGLILHDLGFTPLFWSHFQIAYQSDGTRLVARAVGDLDCDGTTIAYTLEGTAQDGELRYKIVEPTNPD